MIRVKPARRRRVAFARYVTAQTRGGRMLTEDTFGISDKTYTGMPERLLLGAVVEGHKYVPVAPEPLDELPPGDDLIVGGYELGEEAPADDSDGAAGDLGEFDGLDELADEPDGPDGPDNVEEYDGLDELGDSDPAAPDTEAPGGYFCPVCGKPMLNAKGVATHLQRRHPEHTETGEES